MQHRVTTNPNPSNNAIITEANNIEGKTSAAMTFDQPSTTQNTNRHYLSPSSNVLRLFQTFTSTNPKEQNSQIPPPQTLTTKNANLPVTGAPTAKFQTRDYSAASTETRCSTLTSNNGVWLMGKQCLWDEGDNRKVRETETWSIGKMVASKFVVEQFLR
ncbi:hypothetical protein E2542_SST04573 [Spatholobus suberectus]|nr:hypothetical protein E2542_SST04573 [Spatholobus suberectus]